MIFTEWLLYYKQQKPCLQELYCLEVVRHEYNLMEVYCDCSIEEIITSAWMNQGRLHKGGKIRARY